MRWPETEMEKALAKRDLSFMVAKDLVRFFAGHGCPCRFPRFRFVLEFDGARYSNSPTGVHESRLFISMFLEMQIGGFYALTGKTDYVTSYQCRRCQSRFEVTAEDYAVGFWIYWAKCTHDAARPFGAAVTLPMPLVIAPVSNQSGLDALREVFHLGSVDEFRNYMKETAPA